ncbi:MAG: hypothetical protein PHO12_08995 [Bacteroidales bacterium]|nr:hypothetical protein [Bacteroidales bacterium]MDD4685155.1 hypothetical protein [Bacteroidales bacterium]
MNVDIFDVFCMGVDYGQLLMEQERDNEEWADAFNGFLVDQRCSMPANELPRRQPHSEKWREAKLNSYKKFLELVAQSKRENTQLTLF